VEAVALLRNILFARRLRRTVTKSLLATIDTPVVITTT
jgi:hypothetical protein